MQRYEYFAEWRNPCHFFGERMAKGLRFKMQAPLYQCIIANPSPIPPRTAAGRSAGHKCSFVSTREPCPLSATRDTKILFCALGCQEEGAFWRRFNTSNAVGADQRVCPQHRINPHILGRHARLSLQFINRSSLTLVFYRFVRKIHVTHQKYIKAEGAEFLSGQSSQRFMADKFSKSM